MFSSFALEFITGLFLPFSSGLLVTRPDNVFFMVFLFPPVSGIWDIVLVMQL